MSGGRGASGGPIREPDGAITVGNVTVQAPIREPMSPADTERLVDVLGELLRAHAERQAAGRAKVAPPRDSVRPKHSRKEDRP